MPRRPIFNHKEGTLPFAHESRFVSMPTRASVDNIKAFHSGIIVDFEKMGSRRN